MTNINDYRARRDAARAYHPSVRPIWTTADAVDTAQAFAAELANAERGELVEPQRRRSTKRGNWLFGRSRFRRARIYDGMAVALLMTLMAALGVVVFAASAKADPDAEVIAYAAHYSGAVCSVLADYPSTNGMIGIMSAMVDDGLTEYQAGEVMGLSINETCPEFNYLIDLFIARFGDSGQVA